VEVTDDQGPPIRSYSIKLRHCSDVYMFSMLICCVLPRVKFSIESFVVWALNGVKSPKVIYSFSKGTLSKFRPTGTFRVILCTNTLTNKQIMLHAEKYYPL